ncbi:MAG TPA: RnfH family protein [Oleiagrimonas sp.]|nr:RnfH family protein [Oleiagrimonas sp.]
MPDHNNRIRVEVVYAEPGHLWSRELMLADGATVATAVADSGLAADRPDVRVDDDCLGVFGRRVKPDQVLRDGDRVEVYRPLLLDPMEARRRRAR